MACDWIQQLDDARACGLAGALLSFNTSDRVYLGEDGTYPMSLKYFLAHRYHGIGDNVGHFSLANGFTILTPPGSDVVNNSSLSSLESIEEIQALFKAMGRILRDPDAHTTMLFEYASHIAPSTGGGATTNLENEKLIQLEMLHEWSLDDDIRNSGNFLILINHTETVDGLVEHQGGFRSIQIGLPNADQRRAFTLYLSSLANEASVALGQLHEELGQEEFTRVTNGLRLTDIEELFRQGAARSKSISREDVRERKKQTIHQLCGGLLEVAEPSLGFEAIAGCYHAKGYFNAIRPLWQKGHKGLPQAVLLAGVPGGGNPSLSASPPIFAIFS